MKALRLYVNAVDSFFARIKEKLKVALYLQIFINCKLSGLRMWLGC